MKRNWPRLIASVTLIPLTCNSCSLTDRLNAATSSTGKISAGVNLPVLPSDCRKQEPHFTVSVGVEARAVIVGERGALNKANARVTRCASLYDAVRAGFAKPAK